MKARNLILSCTALLLASAAQSQDFPGNEVAIQNIQYTGTGCRPGTVASNISPDGMAMTVLFADYIVDTSDRGGRPARKNCDLQIDLKVPAGWTFSILGHQVRGFVSLQQGAIATQGTTVTPARGTRHALDNLRIPGAFDGDYENFSEVPLTRANWFACSSGAQRLTLNTFITVRPKNGFTDNDGANDNPGLGRSFPSGMITIDSVDNAIGQTYALSWRRCENGQMRPIEKYKTICRIKTPRKEFTGEGADANPARAKQSAVAAAVNACKAGVANRPLMARQCQPARAQCSYVGDKGLLGPGRPGGGPGHGR